MAVTVKGYTELHQRLQAMQQRVTKDGVRKAVLAGAQVFKQAVVQRTPVLDSKTANSTSLEPGALKADIRVRMSPPQNDDVVATIGPGRKTRHVAGWVEYGHALTKKGRKLGMVPAYPFIRPAFMSSEPDAVKAFQEEIKKQVEGA